MHTVRVKIAEPTHLPIYYSEHPAIFSTIFQHWVGFFQTTHLIFHPFQNEEYTIEQDIKENSSLIELEVYAPASKIIIEEEYVVHNINELLGNIGGFLGLLLGASVMSIIDIGFEKCRHRFVKSSKILR
jgi:hypothetical protein